jgi:hypothetical protein
MVYGSIINHATGGAIEFVGDSVETMIEKIMTLPGTEHGKDWTYNGDALPLEECNIAIGSRTYYGRRAIAIIALDYKIPL